MAALALLLVGVAIPCAILIRLIPYEYRMPNLALNGALFLFAGARLGPWPWRVLPFIATAVVDLYFVGIKYGGPSPLIYASYGLYLLLCAGNWRLESPWRIGAVTLAGSVQFFLISNFSVWLDCVLKPEMYSGGRAFYPATFDGLMTCYERGLPFFRGTLISDVCFSAVLFGAHAILARAYFPAEQVSRTEAVQ